MPRSKGRSGRPWQRLRRQVITESTHCHLCSQPLRPEITDPHHPMATVVDHVVSLIEGGHPTDRANLAAAHRRCNQYKELRRRTQRDLNVSREW